MAFTSSPQVSCPATHCSFFTPPLVNQWIQCPSAFSLPSQLHLVETYSQETKESTMSSLRISENLMPPFLSRKTCLASLISDFRTQVCVASSGALRHQQTEEDTKVESSQQVLKFCMAGLTDSTLLY